MGKKKEMKRVKRGEKGGPKKEKREGKRSFQFTFLDCTPLNLRHLRCVTLSLTSLPGFHHPIHSISSSKRQKAVIVVASPDPEKAP